VKASAETLQLVPGPCAGDVSPSCARTAKSVFFFNVQGSVAHSTHAGLPWLLYLRQRLGRRLHFWPFDGWNISAGSCVVAEVYPALWNKRFPREGRTQDQHDAFSIAEWLRQSDAKDDLIGYFSPQLEPPDRVVAEVEGWILGVE
jgi:hypothetical protein